MKIDLSVLTRYPLYLYAMKNGTKDAAPIVNAIYHILKSLLSYLLILTSQYSLLKSHI